MLKEFLNRFLHRLIKHIIHLGGKCELLPGGAAPRSIPAPDHAVVAIAQLAAVRADGRGMLVHPLLSGAVRAAVEAGVPMELLWAPRGLFDEPQGMYDEERLAVLGLPEALRVTQVPDTNHFSILLGAEGIAAIGDAVERHLDA